MSGQVDHELRDGLEHKIERELWLQSIESEAGSQGLGDSASTSLAASLDQSTGITRRNYSTADSTRNPLQIDGDDELPSTA